MGDIKRLQLFLGQYRGHEKETVKGYSCFWTVKGDRCLAYRKALQLFGKQYRGHDKGTVNGYSCLLTVNGDNCFGTVKVTAVWGPVKFFSCSGDSTGGVERGQ